MTVNNWNISKPTPSILSDHDVYLDGDELKNKKVALMVTGGIAAMKSPLIVRALRKKGAVVTVFTSKESLKYTTIDALEWSSNNKVISTLTPASEHLNNNQPFDVYLIAPATYNTINKIACGIADNSVTTALAVGIGAMEQGKSQIIITPTTHGMLHNSLLTKSLQRLKKMGAHIIKPRDEDGKHKLPDEKQIVTEVIRTTSNSPLRNIPLIVTGGPIPSPIDDVRELSNIFTGQLGSIIAVELYKQGADVILVQGPKTVQSPDFLPTITTDTVNDYINTITLMLTEKQYYAGIFSAAVADFQPTTKLSGKISSSKKISINFQPTQKLISIIKNQFPDLYMISFKYEHNISHTKLISKVNTRIKEGYPAIIANSGNDKSEMDEQVAYLVTNKSNKTQKAVGKLSIAKMITSHLEEQIQSR